MGRPRKRQYIDTFRDDPPTSEGVELSEPGFLPYALDDFDDYNDAIPTEPHFKIGQSAIAFLPDDTISGGIPSLGKGLLLQFENRDVTTDPDMNYGDINFRYPYNPNFSADSTSQLPTNAKPSVTNSENLPTLMTPPPPCSCLASMYLSLASLQQFPTDSLAALKIVRGGAAVAAQSIWCPQCGSVVLEDPNPPIEAFQNTMLLGTILPIIANAYQRLIKIVDAETEAALAAGQTKSFRFQDYSDYGYNNQLPNENITICPIKGSLSNGVELTPQQWRTTIRALLKIDIYGNEQSGFKHKGLKDLVAEMEERQKGRHELMHAWAASSRMGASGTMAFGELGKIFFMLFSKLGSVGNAQVGNDISC